MRTAFEILRLMYLPSRSVGQMVRSRPDIVAWLKCLICLICLFVCWFVCLFFVPLEKFSLLWRPHHERWRRLKLWPILGTHVNWAVTSRVLSRDTQTVTQAIRLQLSSPRTRETHTCWWALSRRTVTRSVAAWVQPSQLSEWKATAQTDCAMAVTRMFDRLRASSKLFLHLNT